LKNDKIKGVGVDVVIVEDEVNTHTLTPTLVFFFGRNSME
jgi:hypothetical protein